VRANTCKKGNRKEKRKKTGKTKRGEERRAHSLFSLSKKKKDLSRRESEVEIAQYLAFRAGGVGEGHILEANRHRGLR